MADFGLCGRCLVVLDARTSIRARKGEESEPLPLNAQRTPALAKWALAKIADGWTIEVDDTTRRFDPIATFNGDLVCEIHLWDLVDRDNRMRWK